MSSPLLLSVMLGIGLWLIVSGQPLGRRRPDLAARLRSLSAQGRLEQEERERRGAALFQSALLERLLRPVLDDAGNLVGRLLTRLGVERGDLEQRLVVGWPELNAAQFRGQQLATGAVLLAVFPIMNALGVQPVGPWPVWLWAAAFLLGFAAPSWQLNARLRERQTAVLYELPAVLDLLAIAASAGLAPEQALVEVSRQSRGALGGSLRDVVRDAGLGTIGYAEGLQALAERERVPELRALADAWRLSHERGMPLGPAMLALAETVRDRKRARLLEEGGKGAVRMLFPVALFIFPVFLVVLLYPAGVELLGLGR